MNKNNVTNFDKLFDEYLMISDQAKAYLEAATLELQEALINRQIQAVIPIQGRFKEWERIKEKIPREKLGINEIYEIQDLLGLRVVLLFPNEVQEVERIISEIFKVIRSYDTKQRLKEREFGYLSLHYIVNLPDKKLRTHQISQFSPLMVEIQIRTLAQHLWAEISHKLQYTREDDVPLEIRRNINGLSASLEQIDELLENIVKKRESYRSGLLEIDPNAVLNIDLLEMVLDSIWPKENKIEFEPYGLILERLKTKGITKKQQLISILQKQRDNVIKRSAREAEYLRNLIINEPLVNGSITIHLGNKTITKMNITPELITRVNKGIYHGHVGLTSTAIQFEFGERSPLDEIV